MFNPQQLLLKRAAARSAYQQGKLPKDVYEKYIQYLDEIEKEVLDNEKLNDAQINNAKSKLLSV